MTNYCLYPESFNQLRKKLSEEHEDLWARVGYYMAFDQLEFIMLMNKELDCICIPEQGIDVVCDKYLSALRTRKGKAATKSLELIQKEASNFSLFGTADDDLAREDLARWQSKKKGH